MVDAEPAPAPRCPYCCEHGHLLTRECGWCRDEEREWLAVITPDEPQWQCRHGIGATSIPELGSITGRRCGVTVRPGASPPGYRGAHDDHPEAVGGMPQRCR